MRTTVSPFARAVVQVPRGLVASLAQTLWVRVVVAVVALLKRVPVSRSPVG